MIKQIILFSLLLAWVVSCAVNPVTGKREFMLVSEEQEIAMGREYDPQISQMYGVYDDPELLKYVNDLGQKMAKISHRPNLKYEIKVMDSPVINAFAVPGGYVYITRGILAYLNNEAELAGVMGHEIGHVTARHSAAQMSKAQLAQIGIGVTSMISEDIAQYAGLAGQAVGLLFLKFGRDDERESDKLGVQYSTTVGYDAHEMANFFKVLDKMNSQSGQSLPDFLSTHPNPADRVQDVGKLADSWQKKIGKSSYMVNRDAYLKEIDGIVYGDNPRQGFTENDVFYHPELKFQFPTPAGWTINNLPTQVQMFPADQKAVMVFKLEATQDNKEAAAAFITNNKLTVESQKSISVHNAPAEAVVATATTESGVLKLMAYFIKKDGNVYSFLGYSAQADFANYQNQFTATMSGLNTLTDRTKLNRQPDRLRIKQVSRSATLRDALKGFGVPDTKLEEYALLNNGMNLSDNVQAGSKIKVVEAGK